MTSLISRMRDISSKIKDIESLRATEAEANAFKTRAEELSGLSGQIQQPVRRIQLFRQAGVAVEASYVRDNQLRLDLETMAQEYAEDRKSIIAANPEWRHATKNRLEGVARRSNQRLQDAWEKHVAVSKPPVNSGLLRLLARSRAYQTRSRQIEELLAEFDSLSGRLPTNAVEAEKPVILAERLQALLKELPDDIPEPVRQLFQSINEGTATAAQLTDDARRWLLEHGILSDLRVSWRQS